MPPPEWFDTPYSFAAYTARYNMAPELYYAYSVGLIRFVVIAGYCPEMTSTSTQPCLQSGKPQRVWLEAELATVNRTITVRALRGSLISGREYSALQTRAPC